MGGGQPDEGHQQKWSENGRCEQTPLQLRTKCHGGHEANGPPVSFYPPPLGNCRAEHTDLYLLPAPQPK